MPHHSDSNPYHFSLVPSSSAGKAAEANRIRAILLQISMVSLPWLMSCYNAMTVNGRGYQDATCLASGLLNLLAACWIGTRRQYSRLKLFVVAGLPFLAMVFLARDQLVQFVAYTSTTGIQAFSDRGCLSRAAVAAVMTVSTTVWLLFTNWSMPTSGNPNSMPENRRTT